MEVTICDQCGEIAKNSYPMRAAVTGANDTVIATYGHGQDTRVCYVCANRFNDDLRNAFQEVVAEYTSKSWKVTVSEVVDASTDGRS